MSSRISSISAFVYLYTFPKHTELFLKIKCQQFVVLDSSHVVRFLGFPMEQEVQWMAQIFNEVHKNVRVHMQLLIISVF